MQIYAKVKETRLVGTLLPSDTSFIVSNADDLPTLGMGEYFVVYLKQGLKSETCYCTSVVGTTFTVSRAEENTNPLRFNNGALIEINVTPESYTFVTSGGAVDSVNGQTGTVVLDADDIDDTSTTQKFVTASDLTKLSNTSGTNSGDQTSIVGISGTKAQFDTACSDGNFLYTGDVTQYTDEMVQDAVGGMVDSSLVYVDGTPLLQRAALTGDVTASAGSNSTTIPNDTVTYAKMQNVSATDKILGRSTAGSGDVEEITCTAAGRALIDDADAAAQRTTLGLGTLATQSGTFSGTSSGTNTGDQTSIVGISGTKAQFDTACSDGNFLYTSDIGTNVQAYDAELAALAGLTSAADKLPYFSGSGTAALTDLSSAMRTFMTTPSSANLRSLLSDESGTGAALFQGGDVGTPSAGVLSNCSGYPSDWIKISTGTASSSTSIDFTNLNSTYIAYKVIMHAIAPATDNVQFWLRTSTNNGSAYDSGASDYTHGRFVLLLDPVTSVQAAGDNADAQIIISTGMGNSTEEGYSGEITIVNPSAAKHCRVFFAGVTRIFDTTYYYTNGGGARLATADVDAIRFMMSSGNIASGSFTLYGLRA